MDYREFKPSDHLDNVEVIAAYLEEALDLPAVPDGEACLRQAVRIVVAALRKLD